MQFPINLNGQLASEDLDWNSLNDQESILSFLSFVLEVDMAKSKSLAS